MSSNKKKKEIFRKVALERLSSPEELDVLMQVTGPRSWLAFSALGALLLTVIGWGLVGSVPTRVNAQAILVKSGGVFDVYAPGAGPVSEILVTEGDSVARGELVARVEQPDLVSRIQNAESQIAELRARHAELSAFADKDLSLQGQRRIQEQEYLGNTMTNLTERERTLEAQIANERSLFERGLSTRRAVAQLEYERSLIASQRERAEADLRQLDVLSLNLENQREQELVRSRLALSDAERNLSLLQDQLAAFSEVRSPYPGVVLELQVRRGDVVGRGSSMLSLQREDDEGSGLEAVIYVPPKDGKHVERSMPVQISPLSAPREEYGFLEAEVTFVSEFPSTHAGMMKVLANEVLVNSMLAEGAPFLVRAKLFPKSADETSGTTVYRWSSPKGEALDVNAGTLCAVTITVDERRPIELVIPLLREKTGI